MPVIKEKRHLIVPVFIPHQGCPFKCIYCRQDTITDRPSMPGAISSYIKTTIDRSLKSPRFPSAVKREVAFYGGTFTNLPTAKMKELLEIVSPYLGQGLFDSIRISTRPDCVDEERLELMKSYGVSTVELGVQSMDDNVLILSKRGHTSYDIIKAIGLLKKCNYRVGIQLMPGLPGDTESTFNNTIDKVIDMKPDMVRLYPAVVIKGTELATFYYSGSFRPFTLDEAVRICGNSCISLENNGISVIRIGLMSSPSLLQEGVIVAGPWHTAFGFLVRSYIHHKNIEPFLPKFSKPAAIGIKAPGREISLVRGYKNKGVRLLEEKSGARIDYIKPDDFISSGRIKVDELRQGTRYKGKKLK